MKREDEAIRTVREVRARISEESGNDPEKLIEHYILEQLKYRDRLLDPVAARDGGAAADQASNVS